MTTKTITLETVREMIQAGQYEDAAQALEEVDTPADQRAEAALLRGYVQEMRFDREGAYDIYREVLDRDPDNVEANFRAGLLANQLGDTWAAIELYERCTTGEHVHVNALLNLAVLYEEVQQPQRAETCVRAVLASFPNHTRAQQLLKSVYRAYTFTYDDHTHGDRERRSAVLDLPISDFELSVRSRNCLRQMNIRTLGDLLRTTEADLLSYKNFGETSLSEVKAMLNQKGLALGQMVQQTERPAVPSAPEVDNETDLNLSRSVADLELSVRSRKALQRLGINTIGELAMRSEGELLAIKNFGQTSLSEIKGQLTKFGLSLRK